MEGLRSFLLRITEEEKQQVTTNYYKWQQKQQKPRQNSTNRNYSLSSTLDEDDHSKGLNRLDFAQATTSADSYKTIEATQRVERNGDDEVEIILSKLNISSHPWKCQKRELSLELKRLEEKAERQTVQRIQRKKRLLQRHHEMIRQRRSNMFELKAQPAELRQITRKQIKPWSFSLQERVAHQKEQNSLWWKKVEHVLRQKVKKPGLNLKPAFTQREEDLYQQKLWGGPGEEEVLSLFNVKLMREKLQCLRDGAWLNDEVINLYLKLLRKTSVDRAISTSSGKSSYFHSTFFYTKLYENNLYTYANVSRWTKRGAGKCDLFSQKMVFFPYNIVNTHWTLCVAFMEKREICFYDSMGGDGTKCMENILRYLADESKNKKNEELDTSEWSLVNLYNGVPQQTNGYDCGVFLCIFSLYASMEEEFDFTCNDMPYFRKRIAVDILQGKITYESRI